MAAVTPASIAFPPRSSTLAAAMAASGWPHDTAKSRPISVGRMLAGGALILYEGFASTLLSPEFDAFIARQLSEPLAFGAQMFRKIAAVTVINDHAERGSLFAKGR